MRKPIHLFLCVIGASCASVPPDPVELAHAFLIIDTHIDAPSRLYRQAVDVGEPTQTGDFDYPRARAGGLDAVFMSIFIPAARDEAGEARAFADELIDFVEALVAADPDEFAIATCTADIEKLKSDARVAFALGMENGGPIEGKIENLDHFAGRGIRYITLTHGRSNHIADSSYDENKRWGGLSSFGKGLVKAMSDRGVMIDVSHISDAAFWQVVSLSEVAVVATHSSLRHFTPGWERNMSDDMVRAMGDNGGVIQINFGSSFLTETALAWRDARRTAMAKFIGNDASERDMAKILAFTRAYRETNPYPFATTADVADHIDRVVELIGVDHVGLGSDFDGVGDTLPVGLKDVSAYPNLVGELQARGYSSTDIEKILGGNLMRVWRDVEAYAAAHGYPPECQL